MRGDSSAGDYRKRLYDSYVTTHMKTLGDVNETGLRQARGSHDRIVTFIHPGYAKRV